MQCPPVCVIYFKKADYTSFLSGDWHSRDQPDLSSSRLSDAAGGAEILVPADNSQYQLRREEERWTVNWYHIPPNYGLIPSKGRDIIFQQLLSDPQLMSISVPSRGCTPNPIDSSSIVAIQFHMDC